MDTAIIYRVMSRDEVEVWLTEIDKSSHLIDGELIDHIRLAVEKGRVRLKADDIRTAQVLAYIGNICLNKAQKGEAAAADISRLIDRL